MQNLKNILFTASLFATFALPAFAGVVVNTPSNGTTVGTTFNLSASASTCSSQSVGVMGYSFDSSSTTTMITGQSINQSISTSAGGHTLHVKAWGSSGSSCVT